MIDQSFPSADEVDASVSSFLEAPIVTFENFRKDEARRLRQKASCLDFPQDVIGKGSSSFSKAPGKTHAHCEVIAGKEFRALKKKPETEFPVFLESPNVADFTLQGEDRGVKTDLVDFTAEGMTDLIDAAPDTSMGDLLIRFFSAIETARCY